MTRLISLIAAAVAITVIGTSTASAAHDHGCNCCPCTPGVQATPATHDHVAPPQAPAGGQTQQSQSIEPGSTVQSAPSTGTTFRSYSYPAAPRYRSAPARRQLFYPGQKLKPGYRP